MEKGSHKEYVTWLDGKVIRLLEYAEAHTEARDLLGWAGAFRVAANELREAHRALVALGVRDRESASEFWTSLPTKGDGTTP